MKTSGWTKLKRNLEATFPTTMTMTDDGNGNGSNTMIVVDKNAKESLAKEMKEKDYD